jgi:hypothetical protein
MAIPYQTPGGYTGSSVHVQTRYKSGGVAPHPLQRTGQVSFSGSATQVGAGGPAGMGKAPPVAPSPLRQPPMMPVIARSTRAMVG